MEEEKVICSFCGRSKQETDVLIAGTTGHICNLCISQAHEIISEEVEQKLGKELGEELTLGFNSSRSDPRIKVKVIIPADGTAAVAIEATIGSKIMCI